MQVVNNEKEIDRVVGSRQADTFMEVGYFTSVSIAEQVGTKKGYQVEGWTESLKSQPEVYELLKIIRLRNQDKLSSISPEFKLLGITLMSGFAIHQGRSVTGFNGSKLNVEDTSKPKFTQ